MTDSSKNDSERLVAQLACQSFLALWSYANPRGKAGKELCDVLAVCDPDVVIFSVKQIAVGASGDPRVDWERWQRTAIDTSAKQIYGAERWLRTATHVVRSDGSPGVALPDLSRRRVHRIAVALGSAGAVPLYAGDLGRGFVHVLSEQSLAVLFSEMDTISDLASYLAAKEELVQAGSRIVFQGGEEDLIAIYLTNNRRLPAGHDVLVVGEGIWNDFVMRPEYLAKKEADRDSYVWDRVVDRLSEDILHGELEFGAQLDQNELATRAMARENRFARRILGQCLTGFLDQARDNRVRARMTQSPSDVVYVFLARPHGYPRSDRAMELTLRCFVARGLHKNASTVIGIATEQYEEGKGYSFDVCYLHKPIWTAEEQDQMERTQTDLGYFTAPLASRSWEDEYPKSH